MKKHFFSVFLLPITFFVFCCSGCKSIGGLLFDKNDYYRTEILLDGHFFDEAFMEKAELSWLNKPNGATNESRFEEEYRYGYACVLADSTAFDDYVADVMKGFDRYGYVWGGNASKSMGTNAHNWKTHYSITPFLKQEDYKAENEYELYYSAQGVNVLHESYFG